jgi:hypothetical protein
MMSTRNLFMMGSEIQALSHVASSVIALGQVIYMIPKQTNARRGIFIFSLVSITTYIANFLAIRSLHSESAFNLGGAQIHPIESLVQAARAEYEGLLQRQSQNYTAADAEYRRRYHVEPPPGFQAWYDFAVSHKSPIIDDFDLIHEPISKFWGLSGKEVLELMDHTQSSLDNDTWQCSLSGARAETVCRSGSRSFDRNTVLLFNRLLGGLGGVLPDIKFAVNHLDEPRILIPPQSLNKTGSHSHQGLNITNIARQSTWDAITRFCSNQQIGQPTKESNPIETFSLPFVTDPKQNMNLCQHPEYNTMHGILMHPASFRLVEGLVPILTTGSLSTMGDILFPSPAYMEDSFRYNKLHDIEWNHKQNNLYWAGSTTGGVALDNTWRHYHRQRFVELAQNLDNHGHYYLRKSNGLIKATESRFLNGRSYDVAFTRVFQCERRYCKQERSYFNVKRWASKDQALRSRLVFDIDGNGISGRYYKLLASNSVPLKQTLFREWHDERLLPWIHYIPVSQSMKELPELVYYLTSTESGQRIAREIAEEGRIWYSKSFRDVDMTIYVYRLLLELARIQDPSRNAT